MGMCVLDLTHYENNPDSIPVTLDFSGSPIEIQSGSRKYPRYSSVQRDMDTSFL